MKVELSGRGKVKVRVMKTYGADHFSWCLHSLFEPFSGDYTILKNAYS